MEYSPPKWTTVDVQGLLKRQTPLPKWKRKQEWVVYFLFFCGVLHYIGSSSDLTQRVRAHRALKKIQFDSVLYLNMKRKAKAMLLEEFLIFTIRPVGNADILPIGKEHFSAARYFFTKEWMDKCKDNCPINRKSIAKRIYDLKYNRRNSTSQVFQIISNGKVEWSGPKSDMPAEFRHHTWRAN